MLDAVLGAMSPEDIRRFLDYVNTESIKGRTDLTRFGRHFTNIVAPLVCRCPHEFNEWIGKLWRTEEDGLQEVLESILRNKPIKGAGKLIPTFVLYLRTPAAFNIWTKTLEVTWRKPSHVASHPERANTNGMHISIAKYPTFWLRPSVWSRKR